MSLFWFLIKAFGFYSASAFLLRTVRLAYRVATASKRYQSSKRHGAAGKITTAVRAQPQARVLVASLLGRQPGHNQAGASVKGTVEDFIAHADRVSTESGSNCIVSCDALRRQAADRAGVLDTLLQRRAVRAEEVPLFGLPISVKECYQVESTSSTHGLVRYRGDAAGLEQESVLVRMLRNLGAVPFCKTNVPQIMYSWECSNPVYGTTSHPLHLDYVPGGSSGGEGCLIAQGGSIVGLGTDIGGSCRIPAHMSGCVGLKASKHRLASRGKGRDVTYGSGQAVVASCAGLLARTVDDMVFVLEHLCSPQSLDYGRALDPTLLPIPWRPAVVADTRPLRIAYYDFDGYLEVSPACRRAVREAKAALESAGHTLVEFTPPDVDEAMGIFFALLSSGADHIADELAGESVADALTKVLLQSMTPYALSQLAATLKAGSAPVWAGMVKNLYIKDTTEYYRWVQRKARWVDKYNDALDQLNRSGAGAVDVVLCPVHLLPTHKHGEAARITPACAYAAIYNLLDYTAGVVPVTTVNPDTDVWTPTPGRKLDSMVEVPIRKMYAEMLAEDTPFPVGVQLCARPYCEELALRAMGELERELKRSAGAAAADSSGGEGGGAAAAAAPVAAGAPSKPKTE